MSALPPPEITPEITIEAGHAERQYWRNLLAYRELLYFLAWRDILIRYKQTALGVLWALLRPLLTMLICTFIFGKVAGFDDKGATPYALLVLAGALPWQFFSGALSESGASVLANSGLITKVYFPRLIAPASAVIVALADYLFSFLILAGMLIWYRYMPTVRMVSLPLFSLLAFSAALGAGLWLSALTVNYRDFRFILPFIVQFGAVLSPVGYLSSRVPEPYRVLYALNPMVGIIDGFRWAILSGNDELPIQSLALSAGVTILLLVTGIAYFRHCEQTFADII
jgi:lipopolysaccharide transport system permease protein